MAKTLFKSAVIAAIGVAALASTANAGGFSRGEADTDILYEKDAFILRAGGVYVMPDRAYETTAGRASTDGDFIDNYWIPSVAAKVKISDRLACAFTYTQAFGADATYGASARTAYLLAGNTPYASKGFDSNEYGATCDVNFEAGPGNLHVIAGGFMQDFSYTAVAATANNIYIGTLQLDDSSSFGYRLGLGYEIPEYALRAQLLYRSQVDHTTNSGSFVVGPGGLSRFPVAVGTILPASGYGSLPQSLELSLQTGVAPGWLVYGSVKWTDWSVLKALNYRIATTNFQDVYNWKDGWTVQAGVGHAFTDTVSGTVNLTYDSGVGTGADIATDTWTMAAAAIIKAGPGELRLGGGISYLTAGSQSTRQSAAFNATAGDDWSYSIGSSFTLKF
ncbi:outer membrane protein transport protein [Rhizobium sp. RU36D]|uniref:outer membrane protein transport protein n=1 Tax=Rhizobium sp. RU36D TaxID=1907415 RepID=UPI0009D7C279|nr:outer membrane protein transport protein [Rhizobium sp. RU36D]SMC64486.1 long-chain fatty acid transport protein [Rhizobium sp. RU36D]